MGNCTSNIRKKCRKFTCCCPWLMKRQPNLPSRPSSNEKPKPKPNPTGNKDALDISAWDWRVKENGNAHHTSNYSLMRKDKPELVVRRGQSFSIRLLTNRLYCADTEKLGIILTVADSKNPSFGNGSQVGLALSEVSANTETGWSCQITDIQEDFIALELCSPPSCIVGKWNIEIDESCRGENYNFVSSEPIYILFNPYIKEDSVYLNEPEKLKEYVEDDNGLIWWGTSSRLRSMPWQFAQYEDDVLQCVLYILSSISRLIPANRANPVNVARALSAGINAPDDNGVLVGNWSDSFEGGKAPNYWRGSRKILQQYFESKEPVKFGQCWVFSGVVTTACRALGIPCRSITNFKSAHDTHNSLTLDRFIDDEDEPVDSMNSDSVWNFHVWNECWFRRPDLGTEYDGWQVIDATPQEESDGQYRCGPTSVHSIKEGHIHKPYDVPFVFAEVNADEVNWKYNGRNAPMKFLGKTTNGIGLNISTKAIGKWDREDVTNHYKHEEGTMAERDAMREALKRCTNAFARYYFNQDFSDVSFEFKVLDDIVIGQPFSIVLQASNKGSVEYDVRVILTAASKLYTGTIKSTVKKQEFNIKLEPSICKDTKLEITFDEYYSKLVDQCAMKVSCLATVQQTGFEYHQHDDFRVRKPDVIIEMDDTFKVGKATRCKAHFTNPLPMALNNARFYAIPSKGEGSFCRIKGLVESGAVAECEFDVVPKSSGEMMISVLFLSKELNDVDGFVNVIVEDDESSNGREMPFPKPNPDERTEPLPPNTNPSKPPSVYISPEEQ